MPSVFIVADIGLDQGKTYHVGDEAMFLANYKKYLTEGYKVFASSRSMSHPRLELGEFLDIYIKSWFQFCNLFLSSVILKYLKINFFPEFFRSTIQCMTTSDILHISGGGNLVELWPGHIFYRCFMILTARLYDKKVIITGQGIHYIQNPFIRILLSFSLRQADVLSVRDSFDSISNLKAMHYPIQKAIVDLDDAYHWSQTHDKMIQNKKVKVGLSLHPWGNSKFEESLKYIINTLASLDKNLDFYIIPHVLGESVGGDSEFMKKIIGSLLQQYNVTYFSYDQITSNPTNVEPAEFIAHLTATMDILVATRYHALVFALANGIPVLSLNYDSYYKQKNNGLLRLIFKNYLEFSLDLDIQNQVYIKQTFENFFKNRDKIQTTINNYNIRHTT